MRGGRPLLVLLAVALGLGAYIYFVESKRNVDGTEVKEKVFTLEAGKIEELEVRTTSGDLTKLKKMGTDWQIVAPFAGGADQGSASSVASSLESLEMQKVLEEKPASFAEYGLEPAKVSVTFKTAGDQTPHTLRVGNKTPTGSDVYARVDGQPRLFLISGFLHDTFNRTTFDLRDKALLKFDRDAVDTITEEIPGSPKLTLTRKGTDWSVTEPVTVRADLSPIDGVVGRIVTASMTSVVKDDGLQPTGKELREYGLDTPQLVLTFGAGSTRATLAIGRAKDDKNTYARDLSRPMIFTVEATLLADVKRGPNDVRVRDIFAFNTFSAQSIDVTSEGVSYSFTKSRPAGTDTSAPEIWKQLKPVAKEVNSTAMTDFLNAASSLRATSFASKPASHSPKTSHEDIELLVRFDSKEEHVILHKDGEVALAIRSTDPDAGVVSTADIDHVLSAFKALTSAK